MKWFTLALLITANAQGFAQPEAQVRFAVTLHQVASALMQRGLVVADDQVSLPAHIVSTDAEPLLDISSVEPLRSGLKSSDDPDGSRLRFKVRLACHSVQHCVPFYAIVEFTSGLDLSVTPGLEHVVAVHPAVLPISMRAGSNAILIMDTGKMHIRVPVISLQNGAVGARIHVISPDHKQTYSATIVSATLLTGTL